ncbi:MAG: substrate-binding protein [Burkholderiaceae bacterium]|jgi:ABC-type branched-subunit amino acid transport system substrate-binding protein|nr:substrate-binding protein [Burkholderiales bacterium]MCZ8096772.1 substrate-binding protein [Burkholderiales bacterium]MCZ8340840.1 substrate-binding protein [Burkholderiaceae bacterium]
MTHQKVDDDTAVQAPRGRRGFLFGASALAAAGWTAGGTGSWFLPAAWGQGKKAIRMGIATDITGPIAPSGNSNWQIAQLAVEQINAAGGIAGRPVELFLEDTASDPKAAVANVRKLIQRDKVDVVLGGITSAMRQAIKDPIVNRGKTLYIYPQLYEGQECTKHLFNTGPTPAQQCDELIPYLIKTVGKKRFAMPSANYVWPQLLNKYARKVIEKNGAEVVFEEYYPLDQAEYSATINKIRDGKVDCVFNTIIPPGLQPFTKQLFESGFQKNGGTFACVYFDENSLNYVAPRELEGVYSCLDFFHTVDDPFSKELLAAYAKKFPGTKYQFTAGSAATGMYRGIRLYEAAVNATKGDVARDAVSAALDKAKIDKGPGGGAEMVPGKWHAKMNMYVAQCKKGAGDALRWDIISKHNMVDPKEC